MQHLQETRMIIAGTLVNIFHQNIKGHPLDFNRLPFMFPVRRERKLLWNNPYEVMILKFSICENISRNQRHASLVTSLLGKLFLSTFCRRLSVLYRSANSSPTIPFVDFRRPPCNAGTPSASAYRENARGRSRLSSPITFFSC